MLLRTYSYYSCCLAISKTRLMFFRRSCSPVVTATAVWLGFIDGLSEIMVFNLTKFRVVASDGTKGMKSA